MRTAKQLEETIEKARSRVKNPITAIRAKCVNCVGGEVGTIRNCEHTDCHLYPYRFGKNPYRGKPKLENYLPPMKAIRAECLSCNYTAKEVLMCPCTECTLYPLRLGINPYASEKRRAAGQKLASTQKNMPCTSDSENNSSDEYHDMG